jgi:beta-lactamase regulating signal transducer with metallopeptidase domain
VLALPDSQRQYIVRHEDEHRRSHDSTLLFLASLSVILLPWNAALWWQLRRLSLAVEMDCDRRVVSTLGDAHAYGDLLLTVAQASARGPRLQPALLGGMGMLEHRLTVLLAPAPLRLVQRVVFTAVASVLLFLVLTTPHPVIANHAHARAHTTSSSAMRR